MSPQPPIIVAPGVAGVAYTDPPPSIRPSIQRHLDETLKDIEPGSVVLAAVADRRGAWNATIGIKTKHGFLGDFFVGSKWGTDDELDFGVRVLKVWKLGKD